MMNKNHEFGTSVLRFSTLRSDFEGYSFLSQIQSKIKELKRYFLKIDFSSSSFIDGNLFAVIGAILSAHSRVSLNFSYLEKIFKRGIYGIATRNNFLNYFGAHHQHSCQDTTIQYRVVPAEQITDFSCYIHDDVLKSEFPQMSGPARKKLVESILEIFSNSTAHGRVKKVYVCGQFFPRHGCLKITLVDLGCTIKKNVSNFLQQDISGIDAIQWAISDNNTTRSGHTPGGLGLKLLRNFLKQNNGSLQIVSYDGFWEETPQGKQTRALSTPFEGTIVTIVFNMNDLKRYMLVGEY